MDEGLVMWMLCFNKLVEVNIFEAQELLGNSTVYRMMKGPYADAYRIGGKLLLTNRAKHQMNYLRGYRNGKE